MAFPDFFAQVSPLHMRDPLAALLGAAEAGLITYRYEDAVRLAGHSCPTVAGAWLMTRKALETLYPDGPAMRGGIRVELRDAMAAGTTGVTGSVMGLITGAAGEGGFKGLNGRFARNDLLSYGVAMDGEARFTRLDTGAKVTLSYQPANVSADPAMVPLMQKMLAGEADADERARFGALWQDRVRRILLDHADEVVRIQP